MRITIVVLAAMMSLCSCSSEQEITATDVPPAVIAAFQAKYPGAEDTEWEIEKHGEDLIYEVDFELDGNDMEAEFRSDGSFVEDDD